MARSLYINPAGARLLGATDPAEIIGRSTLDFAHPDSRPLLVEHERRIRAGKPAPLIEARFVRLDGDIRYVEVVTAPISYEGQPAYRVIWRDITEIKQAEALRAGQSRVLEMIATSAPLEDILTSLMHLIESQAEGMLCSVLLLDEDGLHMRHGAAPSLPEAYIRALDGVPIGPRAGSCGTAMYRGEPVIVTDILHDPLWEDYPDLVAMLPGLRACWSTPIFSSQGKVLGSFAMYYREVRGPSLAETHLIDLAIHIAGIAIERKQAEATLRESEAKFRELAETIPAGIGIVQGDRIRYANAMLEQLTDYTRAELFTMDFWDLAHPDYKELIRERGLARQQGEPVPTRYEVPIVTKNGEQRWLDVLVKLIEFEGQPASLSAGYDITERKRAEEELRKYREHLEELVAERTAELAVAKDKAEEADRLKSAFLATMSHELRTPLNSIIGFTGIMLQGLVGPLNDEQQKQLTMVKTSARHLLNLINEVLDLSKIEAGQVELHLEPFDMRALIDKTVQTLAPLAEKKKLKLIADVAPEVDRVISDPRRVEQILINLVNNAIKFTEQGEVRIECRVRDGWLLTSVADTGIGIKPEDMAKLFTTFRQLDSTLARKHEGTGLGLAICQKLADLLGGEIRVESTWGVGSTFTLALPLNQKGE